MLLSFFSSSGYVARPDCLSTFDFDGAVSSFSTVHFGSPVPVRVTVQPSGAAPVPVASKLIAWFDMSFTPIRKSVAATMALRRCGWGIWPASREIENSGVRVAVKRCSTGGGSFKQLHRTLDCLPGIMSAGHVAGVEAGL